jgi:hypothetical protein
MEKATVKMSPMFCHDIVELYKSAITAYNPASPIKSAEDAGALQQLVGLDLQFMVGCDNEWVFPEDDAQPASGAALPPVLPPSTADNDADRPAAAADAAASDPHDFTKWNMLEMGSTPFAQLKYGANNLAASRSAHAALIVFSGLMETPLKQSMPGTRHVSRGP